MATRNKPTKKKPTKKKPTKKKPAKKKPAKKKPVKKKEAAEYMVLIESFLRDIECSLEMFETVIPLLKKQDISTARKARKMIIQIADSLEKGEEPEDGKFLRQMNSSLRHMQKITRGESIFRSNTIVGLVSRYDEFLDGVMKCALRTQPEMATSTNKQVTYDELLTLESLDGIKELFIDKEMDNFFRQSHEDQIIKIDQLYSLGIRKEFEGYDRFIELNERRNLIVHSAGVVNKLYLKKCKDSNVDFEEPLKVGDSLEVSRKYFRECVLCLTELSVRLGIGVALRLHPDEASEIHNYLNEVGYEALSAENWEFALRIFSFGLSMPPKFVPNEKMTRFYVLNMAAALNSLNKHVEAISLLDSYDWSAQSYLILLPEAVIRRDWNRAEKLMSEMDGKKPFTDDEFRTFAVFQEFRRTKNFKRAYKNIFGKTFVVELTAVERNLLKKA